MKKLLITVVALALFTGAASAKTLKTGYPICFTEKSFDELVTAIVNNDSRQINYLEKAGLCGIISTNVEYSLLDRTWTGTAKVRVYVGNESAVAWTNLEATQD